MNKQKHTTSLHLAKTLRHAMTSGDDVDQRLAKTSYLAATTIDVAAGRVKSVSGEDFRAAPRFDDIEAAIRAIKLAGATMSDLNDAQRELAAACLVGYVRGTAADHIGCSTAGRLNELDYRAAVAECFDIEGFSFEEWYSDYSKRNQEQDDQGMKP